MNPVINKLINASALLGTYTAIGYAYGLAGNLPAKQVALAWLVWEAANITIQCLANAFMDKDNSRLSEIKIIALAISDVVGLVALAQMGLIGSTMMGAALVVCTVMARGFNLLSTLTCECCAPGPRFTMDIVGYEAPDPI